MILEVLFDTMIPFLVISIIDKSVETGDINHIYKVGAMMGVLAFCGLWAGVMEGKYGSRASTGFARNLRKAIYDNIQDFSFSNIDKYSIAGLITRLTTDVINLQNAYQMLLCMFTRAPSGLICAIIMHYHSRGACQHLFNCCHCPGWLPHTDYESCSEIFPEGAPEV